MTTLVTGAPGWLGTRLVRRLLKEGRPVRCLVQAAHWPAGCAGLRALEGAEVVFGDLRRPETLKAAVMGIRRIFHLGSVRDTIRVRDFHRVNVRGARNLCDAALDAGVKRLIHVSSISVHGLNDSPERPFVESSPIRPTTPYGESKARCEDVIREAARRGLGSVMLRPGPFYGPGQSPAMARLMALVASGRGPEVQPAGLRSLTHLDNVVDALLLADTHEATDGRAWLISDARAYTTLELLETMADALSVPLRTLKIPLAAVRSAERLAAWTTNIGFNVGLLTTVGEYGRHTFCDPRAAISELGYRPHRTLDEGLRAAVQEHRAARRG